MGSGGDNTAKNTSTSTGTKQQQTKKSAPSKKPAPKTYGIGDNVTVSKMVYKVNKKTTATQVGPSALPSKASGKFVVINVTLKNNGDKAVTVDSSFFKLKHGGKTYDADSSASMSANQEESGNIQNSFFMQQLNPDSTISGNVVFDVAPEVADATDLQLQVQTGLFGTETGIINLK